MTQINDMLIGFGLGGVISTVFGWIMIILYAITKNDLFVTSGFVLTGFIIYGLGYSKGSRNIRNI